MFCRLMIILFFFFFPLLGFAQPVNTPVILVSGSYVGSYPKPLLSASYDNGRTWSVVTDENTRHLSNVTSIQCKDNFCAAVGSNCGGGILVSNNKGYSWSFINKFFDAPKEDRCSLKFKALHCNAQNCLAVGENENSPHLIVEGINYGQFWVAKNISNLPADYSNGKLASVSCSNKFCIAAGKHAGKRPFLVMSQNGGQTWTFVSNTDLQVETSKISLEETACTGNSCIAVGSHNGNLLILSSHNKGITWTFTKQIKNWSYAIKTHMLYNVHCSANLCMALGEYKDKESNSHLLLLRSEDSGRSWEFNNSFPGLHYVFPHKVRCSGTNCIVTGSSAHEGSGFPFILVSHDSGRSWSNRIMNISNLPSKPNSIAPFNVGIDGNLAIIVGFAGDESGNNWSHPMILMSQDSGLTWEYKKVKGLNGIGTHRLISM